MLHKAAPVNLSQARKFPLRREMKKCSILWLPTHVVIQIMIPAVEIFISTIIFVHNSIVSEKQIMLTTLHYLVPSNA